MWVPLPICWQIATKIIYTSTVFVLYTVYQGEAESWESLISPKRLRLMSQPAFKTRHINKSEELWSSGTNWLHFMASGSFYLGTPACICPSNWCWSRKSGNPLLEPKELQPEERQAERRAKRWREWERDRAAERKTERVGKPERRRERETAAYVQSWAAPFSQGRPDNFATISDSEASQDFVGNTFTGTCENDAGVRI